MGFKFCVTLQDNRNISPHMGTYCQFLWMLCCHLTSMFFLREEAGSTFQHLTFKGHLFAASLIQISLGCSNSHVVTEACISPLFHIIMVARKHFQVSNRRPWPDLQLAWSTAWGCCFLATWYIAEHDKTSLTTISSGSTCPQTLCGIS